MTRRRTKLEIWADLMMDEMSAKQMGGWYIKTVPRKDGRVYSVRISSHKATRAEREGVQDG